MAGRVDSNSVLITVNGQTVGQGSGKDRCGRNWVKGGIWCTVALAAILTTRLVVAAFTGEVSEENANQIKAGCGVIVMMSGAICCADWLGKNTECGGF